MTPQMLSNLALEEDNSQAIVSFGGVPALMKCLSVPNKRITESAAKTLCRIASFPVNSDEMVR